MKRLIKYFVFFGGILLIINLSKDIFRLLKAGDEVEVAQKKFLELRQKNQELKATLDYYQSDEFVEKEARNKLNMSRLGETVVILPADLGNQTIPVEHPDLPNWQKWRQLFF